MKSFASISSREPSLGRLALACSLLGLVGCERAPEREPWIGQAELQELASASTRGSELLKQAEAARLRGDDDLAIALYQESAGELRTRDQPRRFECLLQIERGHQAEALAACERATDVRNTPASRRAQVGALLAGAAPATLGELTRAKSLADALLEQSRTNPFGHAAMCDIALKLGNETMLTKSMEELRRVAPDHYETRRLNRLLAARSAARPLVVGWAVLGALLAATAIHALADRFRGSARRAAALLALALLVPQPAAASEGEDRVEQDAPEARLSEWKVDDDNPEGSIPSLARLNENPLQAGYLLLDLGEKAERAEKAGQFLLAARFYRAMARMVPERSIAYGKACAAYEALGDIRQALEHCGLALARTGVRVEDYTRFARLILHGTEPLSEEERADLEAVVAHLRTQGDAAAVAAEKIACDVAVRLDDEPRLAACAAALEMLAPGDAQAASYQWTLALLRKDQRAAERSMQRARELGVAPSVLEKMRHATHEAIPFWRRHGLVAPLAALALAGAFGITLLRGRLRIAV